MTDFKTLLSNFGIEICCNDMVSPYGDGHINDTFIVKTEPKYILQKINTSTFKDPQSLMNNISLVTEFLAKKIVAAGGNPDVETLTIVNTLDGKHYFEYEGKCYRVYKFINGVSYNLPDTELLCEAGRAFGKFQNQLADFDASVLTESIPNFHHTRKRFINLQNAVKEDKAARAAEVSKEIEFALYCEKYVDIVLDGIADGSIPLRVTHNDTKINNVLFDKETNKCLSVIDLDTVMPGSMLYDFGDALRFGASSAKEDETDLDSVYSMPEKFEAFTKGFLGEVKASATPREIELLPLSVLLLTYECGIRFLTDYLEGDTYFKIHYPKQNLDRARNQLKLVADLETKLELYGEIVKKYI